MGYCGGISFCFGIFLSPAVIGAFFTNFGKKADLKVIKICCKSSYLKLSPCKKLGTSQQIFKIRCSNWVF